jgi:hypothetical protein
VPVLAGERRVRGGLFMKRALRAILEYLFVTLRKHRVTASVDPRCTFTQCGAIPGPSPHVDVNVRT